MRDIVKFVLVFLLVFAAWQIFWRTAFTLIDVIGPFFAAVLVVFLLDRLFSPEKRASAQTPATNTAPTKPPVEELSSPVYRDPHVLDELEKLNEVLESRWNESVRASRRYRELRRSSLEAARDSLGPPRNLTDDRALIESMDAILDRISIEYLSANSDERREMRELMWKYPGVLKNLHSYCGRSLRKFRETNDPAMLNRGLAIASIDDLRGNKFYETTLAAIYIALFDAGMNPKRVFREIADMSNPDVPEGIADLLRNFEETRSFEQRVLPQLVRRSQSS